MRFFWHFFVAPYWMQLMGLAFLAVSLFFDRPIVVNLGFSLLIAGTLVNGFSDLAVQFRKWRSQNEDGSGKGG